MNEQEAFKLISSCVDQVSTGENVVITPQTDLVADDILDSLDIMSFLFELEQALGYKINEITDDYSDFRVSSLIKLIIKS